MRPLNRSTPHRRPALAHGAPLCLLLSIVLHGCAGQTPQRNPFDGSPDDAAVTIQISNKNWDASGVDVYCDGTRLMPIRGLTYRGTLTQTIADGCANVSFSVLDTQREVIFRSDPVPVSPGSRLLLQLEDTITFSTWSVRRR